jgi:hypothetical protein
VLPVRLLFERAGLSAAMSDAGSSRCTTAASCWSIWL